MANNISKLTVRTYDKYLVKKLEAAIMKDGSGKPLTDVIYSPFDLAFEYAMTRQKVKEKNQIKFPIIVCHKSAGFSISDMTHRVIGAKIPIYYVDYEYDSTPEPTVQVPNPATVMTRVSRYFQVINVNIPYNIEILTKDEDQAYELAQEIIFLLIRDPYIEVPQFLSTSTVPAEHINDILRFAMPMDNDVAENSALETESDAGKLYRITISVTVNDAALSRDVSANLAESILITVEDGFPDDIPGQLEPVEINISN